MKGILNFIITKIRARLYKIISFYCQTFFYESFSKKKKRTYLKHIYRQNENFQSKKKEKGFITSRFIIIGNRKE